MLGIRGLVASWLLASALASPQLISAEVSGPKIERTRGLEGAGLRRDSLLFSREPGAPMVRRNGLAARTDSRTLSFEQTLENEVIFNTTAIPLFPGPSIAVVCAKCCTKGGVEATYPGDLQDIVNPKFRVDLLDIEAFLELDVVVDDTNQFTIPLLPFLPGLTSINLPGLKAGLFVDLLLVFEISGKADLRGGFYLKIPKGSFFEIDISEDASTSQEFTDVISKALPVTVNNDDTGIEFKASLQLRAEFGVTAGNPGNDGLSSPGLDGIDVPFVDLPDIGAGAVVGAFVNLIEYVANVAPEDTCALQATQELNLNMGVFAKVGVSIEEEFLGLQPSAVTTLLTLPLPSACLLEAGLPAPVRESPLPTAAAECPANTTASGIEDEAESGKTEATAATPAQGKTTAAPSPDVIYLTHAKRAEPSVKELTAVACASQLADCPEDLKTTVSYNTTLCGAPAATGSCFAVSDAAALEPTSAASTKAEAKATGATQAENIKGTGTGVGSAPKETAASDEIVSEETASEEIAAEADPEEDGQASRSSGVIPSATEPVVPPTARSAVTSGGLNETSSQAPESTGESGSEASPSAENIAETAGGSRLVRSTLVLAVAGFVAFILG